MPPYVVTADFLEPQLAAELLALALAREADFRAGRIGGGDVKPATRRAWTMRELGDFAPLLSARLGERLPELAAALRTPPVAAPDIRVELVAYRDGDFFRRHVDTRTRRALGPAPGADAARRIMVLSGVYYLHRQPRAFSGGELRLYPFGALHSDATEAGAQQPDAFVDIEPAHNRLVVFPSWASHEVMPVRCPSGRFEDSRFSINYFVRQDRQPA